MQNRWHALRLTTTKCRLSRWCAGQGFQDCSSPFASTQRTPQAKVESRARGPKLSAIQETRLVFQRDFARLLQKILMACEPGLSRRGAAACLRAQDETTRAALRGPKARAQLSRNTCCVQLESCENNISPHRWLHHPPPCSRKIRFSSST